MSPLYPKPSFPDNKSRNMNKAIALTLQRNKSQMPGAHHKESVHCEHHAKA